MQRTAEGREAEAGMAAGISTEETERIAAGFSMVSHTFMTSVELEVVLHYHWSPSSLEHQPGVAAIIDRFLVDGIFESVDSAKGHVLTEKGKAWVQLILSTPYPMKVFADPRQNFKRKIKVLSRW